MLDGVDVCISAPISQCVRGCLCLFVSLLVGVILLSMGGSPRLAARPPSPITRLPHPTHIITSQHCNTFQMLQHSPSNGIETKVHRTLSVTQAQE